MVSPPLYWSPKNSMRRTGHTYENSETISWNSGDNQNMNSFSKHWEGQDNLRKFRFFEIPETTKIFIFETFSSKSFRQENIANTLDLMGVLVTNEPKVIMFFRLNSTIQYCYEFEVNTYSLNVPLKLIFEFPLKLLYNVYKEDTSHLLFCEAKEQNECMTCRLLRTSLYGVPFYVSFLVSTCRLPSYFTAPTSRPIGL